MMDRPDENLPNQVRSSFESLKRLNVHAAEYWSARDLMPLLGYRQWRRFEDAIRRATTSCQQSGNHPPNHFAGAGKMVSLGSESQPGFTVYDSFGNNMSTALSGAGSYAWRGGEGSVTDLVPDSGPNLIHMQARHYDPTLGRFIQADSMMLASATTQGMNRYIYCENDAVNKSDPTGRIAPLAAILLFATFAGVVNALNGGSSGFWGGFVGTLAAGAIGLLGPLGIVLGSAVGAGLTSALNHDSRKNFILAVSLGALFGVVGGVLGYGAQFLGKLGNKSFLGAMSLQDEAELLYWELHFAAIASDMELVTQCFLR